MFFFYISFIDIVVNLYRYAVEKSGIELNFNPRLIPIISPIFTAHLAGWPTLHPLRSVAGYIIL